MIGLFYFLLFFLECRRFQEILFWNIVDILTRGPFHHAPILKILHLTSAILHFRLSLVIPSVVVIEILTVTLFLCMIVIKF